MIPKKIHYCWFGGNPLPSLAKKCIESWKKFLPDYEIVEWNENNFDVNCIDYVREAYEAKKWAFVSDYARFKIIYEQGGLYFDTDVEIVKDMSHIIEKGAFMGFQPDAFVNPGLGLAAESGMDIYKEILEHYENSHFLNSDGTNNLTTVVDRTTDILRKHGLSEVEEIQQVCGITIYPQEYMNPLNMETGKLVITENTVSIHHFMASWCDKRSVVGGKIYFLIQRIFGKKIADFARKILGKKNVQDK